MNFNKIPYKHLTLFVIGTLISVIISFFITERYLSSNGFELRQNTYKCLLEYLEERNVTDDYFPPMEPKAVGNEEAHVNCSVILKQFNVLKEMESNLYSSYNITTNLCKELTADKKLCLSSNDVEGNDNQSRHKDEDGNVNKTSSCFDVSKYFEVDEISAYETEDMLFVKKRQYCIDAHDCYICIKDRLMANDFETVTLHAKAVNITIVDFKVWEYFTISSRVHQLLDEAQDMRDDAVRTCQVERKCTDLN